MSARPGSKRQINFGEFQLDLDTAELRNNGNKSSLVGQPLQILTVLLDRPGELVTREELKKRLWPDDTFVDFDQSLNKAVNRLREALKDSAEHPRFIETLPRRGYRFIGSLSAPATFPTDEVTVSAPIAVLEPSEGKQIVATSRSRRILPLTLMGLAFGTTAIAAVSWFLRPMPLPQITGMTRLTNDGWRKYALVTDGVRLYFSERGRIFQSSVEGGETTEVVTGLSELDLYDISPRGSELLVTSGVQASPTVERYVWTVSLPSGSTHQVGEIKALWASWTPDGEHIGYATNKGLYLASKDGTDIRRLMSVTGTPWKLQFSPDGKRIRFDAQDGKRDLASIWEVQANGEGMHVVFPEIDQPLHTGGWTSDGRYFFFNSHQPEKDRDEDVWVSTESIAGRNANPSAARLTNGPMVFGYPVPSPDGKRVYTLGTQSRAELSRYDRGAKQFVPYLKGMSASVADISRDGQWVAYVSFPELTLWRCRLDGTERRQLTSGSMQVVRPQWSPDGTQIVFTDVVPGKRWKIYVIPASGGKAEELLPEDTLAEIDPSWSADGNSIVFGRSVAESNRDIRMIDLKTRSVSIIPGSWGLFSPRLSPDGRYLAAFPAGALTLMLCDLRSGEWKAIGGGTFQFNTWSRDSKKVYMLRKDDERSEIVRFDIARQKLEPVVSLANVEQGNREWVGLADDESPLIVLDKSVSDVYRLDLTVP
jgi:Tol biopolymer transport system component